MILDEVDNEVSYYCQSCGKLLGSIEEIANGVCTHCKNHPNEMLGDQEGFVCYICGSRLNYMAEIAQGICANCKASIIRKVRDHNISEHI